MIVVEFAKFNFHDVSVKAESTHKPIVFQLVDESTQTVLLSVPHQVTAAAADDTNPSSTSFFRNRSSNSISMPSTEQYGRALTFPSLHAVIHHCFSACDPDADAPLQLIHELIMASPHYGPKLTSVTAVQAAATTLVKGTPQLHELGLTTLTKLSDSDLWNVIAVFLALPSTNVGQPPYERIDVIKIPEQSAGFWDGTRICKLSGDTLPAIHSISTARIARSNLEENDVEWICQKVTTISAYNKPNQLRKVIDELRPFSESNLLILTDSSKLMASTCHTAKRIQMFPFWGVAPLPTRLCQNNATAIGIVSASHLRTKTQRATPMCNVVKAVQQHLKLQTTPTMYDLIRVMGENPIAPTFLARWCREECGRPLTSVPLTTMADDIWAMVMLLGSNDHDCEVRDSTPPWYCRLMDTHESLSSTADSPIRLPFTLTMIATALLRLYAVRRYIPPTHRAPPTVYRWGTNDFANLGVEALTTPGIKWIKPTGLLAWRHGNPSITTLVTYHVATDTDLATNSNPVTLHPENHVWWSDTSSKGTTSGAEGALGSSTTIAPTIAQQMNELGDGISDEDTQLNVPNNVTAHWPPHIFAQCRLIKHRSRSVKHLRAIVQAHEGITVLSWLTVLILNMNKATASNVMSQDPTGISHSVTESTPPPHTPVKGAPTPNLRLTRFTPKPNAVQSPNNDKIGSTEFFTSVQRALEPSAYNRIVQRGLSGDLFAFRSATTTWVNIAIDQFMNAIHIHDAERSLRNTKVT
jgi:hypothetical protein